MSKEKIQINDFILFFETMKSLSRMANTAKLTISDTGLSIYGKNNYARCEILTDSIVSSSPITFCIGDLGMFNRILTTVKNVHDDYSIINMYYDDPFIKFESKKFKTKLNTCTEDIVVNFISKPITTPLTPVCEFTTNPNLIKAIKSHSFIFPDSENARVYLSTNADMENNVVYATIGNSSNNLNNSVTLKFGLINFGSIDNRKLILDFNRIEIFNMVQSDEIKIELMNLNVLVCKTRKLGSNNNFSNITIYDSVRKD